MSTNASFRNFGQLVAILCCLMPAARQASALPFSVGARLSIVSLVPSDRGAVTIIAAPATPAAYQPGLTVGISDSLRRWTVTLEGGYLAVHAGGFEYTQSNVGLGLERAVQVAEGFDPYLALRVTRVAESGPSAGAATATITGALGLRLPTGARSGAFRLEVSCGSLPSADEISRPRMTIWAATVGFELWP